MPCSLCHALYAMLSMPCSHCFNLIATFLLLPSLPSHYCTLIDMFLSPCSCSCPLIDTILLLHFCCNSPAAMLPLLHSHHCSPVAMLLLHSCCYALFATISIAASCYCPLLPSLITMLLLLLSHSASYHYDLIAVLLLPYACCGPHCLSLLHSYCYILIAMLLLLYAHCFLSVAMFSSLHSCCQTFAMVLLPSLAVLLPLHFRPLSLSPIIFIFLSNVHSHSTFSNFSISFYSLPCLLLNPMCFISPNSSLHPSLIIQSISSLPHYSMLYYAQSTAVLNAVSPESSPPFHFSFTTFITISSYLISRSLTLIPCLPLKYLFLTTSSILHSIIYLQHLHCFPQSLAIFH